LLTAELDLLDTHGPSIYDVHMEGFRLRWTHVNGEEMGQLHVDVHTEN